MAILIWGQANFGLWESKVTGQPKVKMFDDLSCLARSSIITVSNRNKSILTRIVSGTLLNPNHHKLLVSTYVMLRSFKVTRSNWKFCVWVVFSDHFSIKNVKNSPRTLFKVTYWTKFENHENTEILGNRVKIDHSQHQNIKTRLFYNVSTWNFAQIYSRCVLS